MEVYDLFMIAVLALCMLFGAWKGMAWQLAALASLVVSALVAAKLSGPLAPMFSVREPWNRSLAMLVLYVATSLVIWLLFRLVAKFIDRVRLKEFDRQIGAMFGLAKGVLWCLVITFFTVTLSEDARQRVLRSRSGYYATVLIHRASPVLPPKVREVLGKYIDQLHEKLHPDGEPPDELHTQMDADEMDPDETDPDGGAAAGDSDRNVANHGTPPARFSGGSADVGSPSSESDNRFRTVSEPWPGP